MPEFKPGLGACMGLAMVSLALARPAGAAETIVLTAGFTQMLRPARAVRTIAIGNPLIADATVGDARTIILTGKAVGTTNLILLDEAGEEISNATVRVTLGRGREVKVRDTEATRIFMCAPGCDLVGASAPVGTAAAATPVTADTGSRQSTPPPPSRPTTTLSKE